ncbi:response regulator [Kineosporia sp. J2-2]|uniref:Response regulator n=1 Tax=Kineosporia corallincola TaxID=2835133 RepID=A0ABS5TQG5_9ACTN|nr:response regulator [Kineosporia corallincola]MBT0773078.1 response regulator [Kineosporia corallincola]
MSSIVVVDDDSDIRGLLEFKLSAAGHQVTAEADGEAGLAAIMDVRPDVVVLDWMMPRMSGIEVCLELRKDPSMADIPVLFLTAKAQESDVQRGFAAGGNDYVIKPFSPRELSSRIDALLARTPR